MSQWTHFLGVVRFDSLFLNVYPEPANKTRLAAAQVEKVHRLLQRGCVPMGSEGPIEFETVQTGRGPTVVIVGDLRDFGSDKDLQSVVDWLNQLTGEEREIGGWIRDAFVRCAVEFKEYKYITINPDSGTFCLSDEMPSNFDDI